MQLLTHFVTADGIPQIDLFKDISVKEIIRVQICVDFKSEKNWICAPS